MVSMYQSTFKSFYICVVLKWPLLYLIVSDHTPEYFWTNINTLLSNRLFKCTYIITILPTLKKQNHLPPEWKLENLFIAALGPT